MKGENRVNSVSNEVRGRTSTLLLVGTILAVIEAPQVPDVQPVADRYGRLAAAEN